MNSINWKNLSAAHKVAAVIAGIAAVITVIGMINPGLFPVDVTTPAIAVFTVCEAILSWNQNRKLAYLMIGAAIVALGCFSIELLLL